jgi:hypothetical protein
MLAFVYRKTIYFGLLTLGSAPFNFASDISLTASRAELMTGAGEKLLGGVLPLGVPVLVGLVADLLLILSALSDILVAR